MKWYVLTGIVIAGAATAAGLGYYILKPRRNNDENDPEARFTGEQATSQEIPTSTPRYTASTTAISPVTSGFPLKRGSRSEQVRTLQEAIIRDFTNAQTGYKPLPKYGADGDWGAETQKFFDAHPLFKSVIDQTTYTDYITGNWPTESSGAPKTTATNIVSDIKSIVVPTWIVDPKVAVGYMLFDTAKAKSLQNTLTLLKKLTSVTDYTSASKGFQLRPWKAEISTSWGIPSVSAARYTLVTGLLDAFTKPSEKNQLRTEFRRMGLKETVKNSDPTNYDSTWSLSGLGKAHRNIRTTMRAIITDGFNVRVEVPARTLLGQWLSSGNGYTRFRTPDGRDMYVRSNAIVFA